MKQPFFLTTFFAVLALATTALVGCNAVAKESEAGKSNTLVQPAANQTAFQETVIPAAKIDTAPQGQFDPRKPLPAQAAATPIRINWKVLEDVKFAEKFYTQVNAYMLFPTFGPQVKNLNGKYVEIEGYIIPVDQDNNLYVISAYNNASCFFCGQAGPNSVMELDLARKHPEFRMDQWQCFRGYLRLNDSDIDRMNFILEKAETCN